LLALRPLVLGQFLPHLQPILNKNSPQAYAKLGFDMLGVAKKLVKYVVHLFKIIKTKRKVFSFSQGA
jgi:hypothetical protein